MKRANLPIKSTKTGKWMLSIPPHLSPNGKRYRPTFDRKSDAEAERLKLLSMQRAFGALGSVLKPVESDDAKRALEILSGTGLTLVQVAVEAVERRKIKKSSKSVAEILEEAFQIKIGAKLSPLPTARSKPKPLRDATIANLVRFYGLFNDVAGNINASDLDTATAKKLLRKVFRADSTFDSAVSHLSPAFSLAVKAGWSPVNPFSGIEKEHKKGKTDILKTAMECAAILAACKDYRRDETMPEYTRVDCRKALVPIAILLFAGVRPARELVLLDWSNISLGHGHIQIPEEDSKTETMRYIEIMPNLRAWIETIPPKDRQGSVIPANWQRIYKATRYASGLNKRDADILRHTYASMFLRSGRSLDELLLNMGHTTDRTTKEHYLNAVEPNEARKFWLIGPPGWTPLQTVQDSAQEGRVANA